MATLLRDHADMLIAEAVRLGVSIDGSAEDIETRIKDKSRLSFEEHLQKRANEAGVSLDDYKARLETQMREDMHQVHQVEIKEDEDSRGLFIGKPVRIGIRLGRRSKWVNDPFFTAIDATFVGRVPGTMEATYVFGAKIWHPGQIANEIFDAICLDVERDPVHNIVKFVVEGERLVTPGDQTS